MCTWILYECSYFVFCKKCIFFAFLRKKSPSSFSEKEEGHTYPDYCICLGEGYSDKQRALARAVDGKHPT